MHRSLVAVSYTLLVAGMAPPASALEEAHCTSGEVGLVKTYLGIDGAGPADPRANANGIVRLRGWVHIPDGEAPPGGFPAIVFNHGSEDTPAAKWAPAVVGFLWRMGVK